VTGPSLAISDGASDAGHHWPITGNRDGDLVETKVGTGTDIPKSILASRLYERIGVALQKGNAQGILAFRYAEMDQPEDMEAAKRDAVMDKLTTKTILSLATCDADLKALAEEHPGADNAEIALAALQGRGRT